MDSVRLDDLVLECCTSHMDFVSRILQEPVSRRFANFLRPANRSCKISLTIHCVENHSTEETIQFHLEIACNGKQADWKTTELFVFGWELFYHSQFYPPRKLSTQNMNCNRNQEQSSESEHFKSTLSDNSSLNNTIFTGETKKVIQNNIHRVLLEIFDRFKRFNKVTFSRSSKWERMMFDILLTVISQEDYQPTSFRKLVFTAGAFCSEPSKHNYEFSASNSRFIEIMSPLLEEIMLLDAKQPHEGTDFSKCFWTAISKCTKLKKMYLCRQRGGTDLFLNRDVRDCLKSLKIREFHTYDNNEENFGPEWIVESFKNNANIRKIFINPDIANMCWYLADPTVISLISRLRSVELAVWMNFETFYEINYQTVERNNNIRSIMKALPEHGYLNLEIVLSIPETTPAADDQEILKALLFWIKLGDETKKSIRMYARIQRQSRTPADAFTHRAVDDLRTQQELAGINIEHRTNRSILRFNDVRISLYYKLLAWKPYLTAEYEKTKHNPVL